MTEDLRFKSTGRRTDDRWYDWRLKYWDTKWDCYDLGMSDHDLPQWFRSTVQYCMGST